MPVRHRTSFPPSPPKSFRGLAQWEVVSSYSSATAPDSHGISCADPLFQARKELRRGLAACAFRVKIIKSTTPTPPSCRAKSRHPVKLALGYAAGFLDCPRNDQSCYDAIHA